ncbi:MAG: ABC transporter substrate-binding protein [Streptomycetales bacterium]
MGEKRLARRLGLALSLCLTATACGGGDTEPAAGGGKELSLPQVRMAMDNEDYMNQIGWMAAEKRYWPDLGFTESADVVATEDYMAGLVGGDVWVAQGESDTIWPATAEGSVDFTIVGVEKDTEAWFLGVREGVDPNDLAGLRISGGPPGDRNITVGRHILRDRGVDPDSMKWVSVDGGSDERLQVLVAGQIDVAVLQPRHMLPLKQAGGQMIHRDYKVRPQETWIVKTDTLQQNKDAVCAYVQGRVAAKQWLSAGPEHDQNMDAALDIGREYQREPSEGEIQEWENEMTKNWSLDGGAPAGSFDKWTEDMIAGGSVPKGYEWRDHVDFDCLWQAQDALGLPKNPAPGDL